MFSQAPIWHPCLKQEKFFLENRINIHNNLLRIFLYCVFFHFFVRLFKVTLSPLNFYDIFHMKQIS